MKALFYNFSKKKFLFKEIVVPKIKPDELLIKIKVSALCGTDLHIIKGPLTPKVYNKKEIILGHSFTGVILKTGAQVQRFKKGDRVFASTFTWCGKCQRCKEGKINLCDHRFIFGMEKPGSNAEYIVVPQRIAFHLPSKVDFISGSLIFDLLALDVHAIGKMKINSSDQILIMGTGPVGLVLGILLRLHGLKSVFITEPIKYRLNLAKKLFKAKIIDIKKIKNFNNSFDVVFDTSGDIKAWNQSQKLLKRGGEIVMIGVPKKNFNLNAIKLVSRELSLFGIFEFTIQDIKDSLKILSENKNILKRIVTHKFPLENGEKAYRLLRKRKAGRIILF